MIDISSLASAVEILRDNNVVNILAGFGMLYILYSFKSAQKLLLRRLSEDKTSNSLFNKIVLSNLDSVKMLKEFLTKIDCDRILVVQYHNGGHLINGVSFTKMSCTHEVINTSCRPAKLIPVQQSLVYIPVTAYYILNKIASEKKQRSLTCLSSLQELDWSTYLELKRQGVKSFVINPIISYSGELTGFILFQWCFKKKNFTPKLLDTLNNFTTKFSTVLDRKGQTD